MKTVIFLTDRQLEPDTRGHRVRINGLILAVKALGFDVVLISVPQAESQLLRSRVKDYIPVEATPFKGGEPSAFCATPFLELIPQVIKKFQPAAVIAEYIWMAPCLKAVPAGVTRILDAHDLMSHRTERFTAAGRDPWVYCQREQEVELLKVCDVLIAIQPDEAKVFKSLRPDMHVEWIPPVFHPFPARDYKPARRVIVTVGSDHPGNYGIAEFAQRVWPEVLRVSKDAQLIVAGSICKKLPPDIPNCTLVHEVSDLLPIYDCASIVVCPIDVGTGLKIKVAEALAYARPVVGTSIAFEGFPKDTTPIWLTADSPSDCAEVCSLLLHDHPQRLRLSSLAYTYAKKYFSLDPVKTKLRRCLFHKK